MNKQTIQKIVNDALIMRMEENRWSQRALAKAADIPLTTLNNRINGKSDWKIDEAHRVAQLVGIPDSEILLYFINAQFYMSLRQARERSCLTIEDAAKAIGIKTATLKEYEQYHTSPRTQMGIKIAQVYGTSFDRIFWHKGSKALDLSTVDGLEL